MKYRHSNGVSLIVCVQPNPFTITFDYKPDFLLYCESRCVFNIYHLLDILLIKQMVRHFYELNGNASSIFRVKLNIFAKENTILLSSFFITFLIYQHQTVIWRILSKTIQVLKFQWIKYNRMNALWRTIHTLELLCFVIVDWRITFQC